MRVRIALALALVAIATGLVIDMSGAAPRLAGGNDTHWPAPDFSDVVPGGGSVCDAGTTLPADAARMVMTIGSNGRPLPRISVTFAPTGSTRTLGLGGLAAGGVQGAEVSVPLRHPHGPSAAGTLCLRVGGQHPLVFGDEAPVSGSTIDGKPVPGTVVILYYRAGSESWWSLLGALDTRFGLGKWGFFGDWTLPVMALAMLALFAGVIRLLIRELS